MSIYPNFANLGYINQLVHTTPAYEPKYTLILPKKPPPRPTTTPAAESKYADVTLSAASYNIMRDDAHENVQSLKYCHREDNIMRQINDMGATIVALQECRDLPNAPFSDTLKKLRRLGYRYSQHQDDKNPKLRIVTLWLQHSELELLESSTHWLNPDFNEPRAAKEWNQKTPRPVGCDVFRVAGTHQLVLVYNTHLGHAEYEKNQSIILLKQQMMLKIKQLREKYSTKDVELTNEDISTLFMADCNFFYQLQGKEQRHLLCTRALPVVDNNRSYVNAVSTADSQNQVMFTAEVPFKLDDLTVNARLILGQAQEKEHGTFVGSSIDREKPKLGQVGNPLDIIAGQNVHVTKSLIYNKTGSTDNHEPEYLANYDVFPSDHLPLFVSFIVKCRKFQNPIVTESK
jgi:endonuclease/exonuclease/phosphatase family metal-dependent hydrolase